MITEIYIYEQGTVLAHVAVNRTAGKMKNGLDEMDFMDKEKAFAVIIMKTF